MTVITEVLTYRQRYVLANYVGGNLSSLCILDPATRKGEHILEGKDDRFFKTSAIILLVTTYSPYSPQKISMFNDQTRNKL